jgi:hypothetical protein
MHFRLQSLLSMPTLCAHRSNLSPDTPLRLSASRRQPFSAGSPPICFSPASPRIHSINYCHQQTDEIETQKNLPFNNLLAPRRMGVLFSKRNPLRPSKPCVFRTSQSNGYLSGPSKLKLVYATTPYVCPRRHRM